MKPHEKLILLSNDDGIQSPGLRAAAEALSKIGWVTVVAPLNQWSGAGRSLHLNNGAIHVLSHEIGGDHWEVYAVEGTPAQAVQHGVLELVPRQPDLVVAGINYGENVGTGVTISGTVGAAMEAAAFGIPAMAISLETPKQYHTSYSTDINFATAAHFAQKFALMILNSKMPFDVDVMKVEVPAMATPDTMWRVTRLSRQRYFTSVKPTRAKLSDKRFIDYQRSILPGLEPDSDVAALVNDRVVSVTPLSLDLTSRVKLDEWEKQLHKLENETDLIRDS